MYASAMGTKRLKNAYVSQKKLKLKTQNSRQQEMVF